jgi:integrase
MTWHQFRHIHASLLNDLQVPVKIAQEQLGHASVTTTLNVYTHPVDASHRRAVHAVEDRLFIDLDSNGLESANPAPSGSPASACIH